MTSEEHTALLEYVQRLEKGNEEATTLLADQQKTLTNFHSLIDEQMHLLRKQRVVIDQFLSMVDNEMKKHEKDQKPTMSKFNPHS